MRKHTLILFALLLGAGFIGATLPGIAQENNGYIIPDPQENDGSMTLIAGSNSSAMPDGSFTVPRDGTINVPGEEALIVPGEASLTVREEASVNPPEERSVNASAKAYVTVSGDRFETVSVDGTSNEGYIDAYLSLKQGVDKNVGVPEDWKMNTRIGLSNEEVARMIIIDPDPVVDRFHLKVPAEVGEVKKAGFYNMNGRNVRSFTSKIGNGKDRELEMDATDLVPGLYFLRIENEAGTITRSFEVIDP